AIDRRLEELTKGGALSGVRSLDLGYGLEKLSQDELTRFLSSSCLGDLEELAFSPHDDVPTVWKALASFPRLAQLRKLGVQQLLISPERARWLGRALPALERLDCDRSLSGASLEALAESATFTLKDLFLMDSDGLYGRRALLGDEFIARALGAPSL